MLLIQTFVQPSKTHGLGLFADEAIKEGTRIWQFSPKLDLEIDPEVFDELSGYEQDFINFYGFQSLKTNNYHLSFDNVRFMNHAKNGNVMIDLSVDDVEYPLVAKRNIKKGEELTQNYYEFDDNHLL